MVDINATKYALRTKLERALLAGRPFWCRPYIGPSAWTTGEAVQLGEVRKNAAGQWYIAIAVPAGAVCGSTEPTHLDGSQAWDGSANASIMWNHLGAAAWDPADDAGKPTITLGNTSTPAGLTQVFPASNTSVFTLRGCSGEVFNTSRLRLRVFNDGVGQRDVPGSVVFNADSPKIAFRVKDGLGGIRLFANGRPLTMSPQFAGTTDTYPWFTVDWGARATRPYEMYFGKNTSSYLMEIAVATGDQVWAHKPPISLRGAFIYDSFLGGSGYGPWLVGNTLSNHFGRLIGIDDMWNFGIGGTGLLNAGAGPYSTYIQRLPQVLALEPDVVFIGMSINDGGYTSAQVQAALTALLTAIRADSAAPVFIFGVQSIYAAPSTVEIGTVAALAANTFPNIFYASMMSATPPWFSSGINNSGYTWSSNTTQYIGGDGVHPVDKGTMYLAHRMLSAYAGDMLPLVA